MTFSIWWHNNQPTTSVALSWGFLHWSDGPRALGYPRTRWESYSRFPWRSDCRNNSGSHEIDKRNHCIYINISWCTCVCCNNGTVGAIFTSRPWGWRGGIIAREPAGGHTFHFNTYMEYLIDKNYISSVIHVLLV